MSPLTTLGEQPMLQALFRKLRALADRRLPDHLREARRGEDLAYRYLSGNGYRIVARNYRSRSGKGEIDLVGWDQDRLAFIEVKTRASDDFGRPSGPSTPPNSSTWCGRPMTTCDGRRSLPGRRVSMSSASSCGTRDPRWCCSRTSFQCDRRFRGGDSSPGWAVVRVEGLHAAVRPHPRIERMTYFAARCSPAPSTCR